MCRSAWLGAVLVAIGCDFVDEPGVVYGQQDTQDRGDVVPPVIEHDPVEESQLLGEPVSLSATVSDDESSVFVVQVFFRQETSSMWDDSVLVDMDLDGVYDGQIPGSAVNTGGMYYYLYAMDTEENEALLPLGGEGDPWHFRISPAD